MLSPKRELISKDLKIICSFAGSYIYLSHSVVVSRFMNGEHRSARDVTEKILAYLIFIILAPPHYLALIKVH